MFTTPWSKAYAFDARTGEEVWAARLEGNVNANPMSYLGRSGRQYVTAIAGGFLAATGAHGAKIVENVRVTGFDIEDGRILDDRRTTPKAELTHV